jgi:hypothetical protein
LRRAWRSLWELRPHHEVPAAARFAAASLLALTLALGSMSIVAIFGTVERPGWWWASLLPNIGICLCIVHGVFGVLRLGEWLLPPPFVERMSALRDLRAGLALGALALCGIVLRDRDRLYRRAGAGRLRPVGAVCLAAEGPRQDRRFPAVPAGA